MWHIIAFLALFACAGLVHYLFARKPQTAIHKVEMAAAIATLALVALSSSAVRGLLAAVIILAGIAAIILLVRRYIHKKQPPTLR